MHNIKFLLNVFSNVKIPNHWNFFSQKVQNLSQLLLKRLENTPVFLILKKGILIQFFSFRKTTQEEVSKIIRGLNTK